MISFSNHRWLIVTVVHYITLFFLSQLNYYLAPVGIQLIALGMLISFSAFELNFQHGFLSLVPIAFYLDSKMPLPFGFVFILTISLFTITHVARSRVRREVNASALITSLALNLVVFGAYTVGTARYLSLEGLHFGPFALNIFASALVIAILNRLFFQVQTGTLAIFGINLAEEQRAAR
ncbi:hypothetical protein [Pelagicoccus sp. SDUM812003]|uniref:hypothetical protein n=1 Tax=Pelagicoccus sp. SDUM812003 TaxID=3041267 RepID=UPI00281017BB|nr:hypothetical protein [Pelagicoccus sp. SDUM812003]MDQ8203298.1 hypothetical protein [Pelagicoccus sp. SDUM812003]